MTKQDQ